MTIHRDLHPREREIMESLYARGNATVAEVLADLSRPPTYSAVRGMLRKMEKKGYITHGQDGARYVYQPLVSRILARDSALERLVKTFFDDSTSEAMSALLDLRGEKLSEKELESLSTMIANARRKGR